MGPVHQRPRPHRDRDGPREIWSRGEAPQDAGSVPGAKAEQERPKGQGAPKGPRVEQSLGNSDQTIHCSRSTTRC